MPPPDLRLVPRLSRQVRADCPDCRGALAILKVIAGRGGAEYWTLRCTRCGGIHLDIVKPDAAAEFVP